MYNKLFLIFFFTSTLLFSQTKKVSLFECFDIAKNNNLIIRNGLKDSLRNVFNIKKAKDKYLPIATISGTNSYDFGTAINPSSNHYHA